MWWYLLWHVVSGCLTACVPRVCLLPGVGHVHVVVPLAGQGRGHRGRDAHGKCLLPVAILGEYCKGNRYVTVYFPLFAAQAWAPIT